MQTKSIPQQLNENNFKNPLDHIVDSTGAKIRVFLTEIAEGVTNYRSLHSLTQQVEHQYHGRFLLELIQNAHDALNNTNQGDQYSRISIALIENDSEHGTLYIANDGQSFSASNFEGLSQLGQSDKDPQKSIGNKGIGFRSVLEICSSPEIYSRLNDTSQHFDGYCFGFDPSIIASLTEPIIQLMGGIVPTSPIANTPIVDWAKELLEKFKAQAIKKGSQWLEGELKFLSPYLLPVPINKKLNSTLESFETDGYSTVIRLPLKSREIKEYVQDKMNEVSASTVLFLNKLTSLTITNSNGSSHIFSRLIRPFPNLNSGSIVTITDSIHGSAEYAIWDKSFYVKDSSQEFKTAIKNLPGKWPEINEISLSLAAKLGTTPDEGKYSVFLPTLLSTGSSTHINAPFFADMSRTSIDFKDPFNSHLLEVATDLIMNIVRNELAGKGPVEARLIVDLLAPLDINESSANQWKNAIEAAASRSNASLDEEKLFLAEKGWRPLNQTSLLPVISGSSIVTSGCLRRHATFDIFHPELDSRITQIKAIADDRYETGIYPSPSDLAETLEKIAAELLQINGDWNGFWTDVMALYPGGSSALIGYNLILGNDNQLHSVSDDSTVFFYPRQGTADDSEVTGEGKTLDVPKILQSRVAFLSDKIRVYEEKLPTQGTAVRKFLANSLVTQFRLEDIFTSVLQKNVPNLPVNLNGKDSALCRDILLWGLNLIKSAMGRGRSSDAIFKLLKVLPVPCNGGWYPLNEASFGPEWPETGGELVYEYLNDLELPSSKVAAKQLLLPPSHNFWGRQGLSFKDILAFGGVFNGLRLQSVFSKTWQSKLYANATNFKLPNTPPTNISQSFWQAYCSAVNQTVKIPYTTSQPYIVGEIKVFPGLEAFEGMSIENKKKLSKLIFYSLPKWKNSFEQLTIYKDGGEANRIHFKSPLMYFLEAAPWIGIEEGAETKWARPKERWYVHVKTMGSRVRNFAHLYPFPLQMAKEMALNPDLVNALINLGTPQFDIDSETLKPDLINILAQSVGSELVIDSNVLYGQIKDAWRVFRPPMNQAPLDELVVRRSSKQLVVINPTVESPAYLPDVATFAATLERFDLPVITIETNDAKNLKEWFVNAYGPRIQLTSNLSPRPFISDDAWTGTNAISLMDSELSWLIVPLLAIIAFHGPSSRGVNSQAFRERLDTLKNARLDWVPSLSVGLMKTNEKIAEMPASAIWHKDSSTIIASEICRIKLDELSVAITEALNREDLELPLRLAFSQINTVQPTDEEIQRILLPLRITDEHLEQVKSHLHGDLENTTKWLDILFKLICPTVDTSQLLESSSEEEMLFAIKSFPIDKYTMTTAIDTAKSSPDMFDFGRKMYFIIGEAVALPSWNKILQELNIPSLKNRSFSVQIQAQIEEVSTTAKKVVAHVLKTGSTDLSLNNMYQQFRDICLIENLEYQYWEINFKTAMSLFAKLVASWCNDDLLVTAIERSNNLKELQQKLIELDIDLTISPDDINRRNHHLVETLANRLEKIRLAWDLKNLSADQMVNWKNESIRYIQLLQPNMEREGFVNLWNESFIFELLKSTQSIQGASTFWNQLKDSSSFAELENKLNLSADDLKQAENKLIEVRKEANRKKSIIKICGRDFDNSEENLSLLWEHIEGTITADVLAAMDPLNLTNTVKLQNIKKKANTKNNKPGKKSTKKSSRQSKVMDELVGLAGEIHAFRMLQLTYGEDVISSSAWVSENSLNRFPNNHVIADDSKGFDITFNFANTLYRVEVKSTTGEDDSFSLGSSEIRLAMELARSRKRPKELFILVHVKNALSERPSITVLPNPYSPAHQNQFLIEEAEARVRYRL